jgi:hypothetical protein
LWSTLYSQLNKSLKNAGDLYHYANYVSVEIGEMIGEESLKNFLAESEQ